MEALAIGLVVVCLTVAIVALLAVVLSLVGESKLDREWQKRRDAEERRRRRRRK